MPGSMQSIFWPFHEMSVLIETASSEAQASLRICADSPEPLLFEYTKHIVLIVTNAKTKFWTSCFAEYSSMGVY